MSSGIYLHSPGLVCALGHGIRHVRQALWDAAGPAGLTHTERYSPGRSLPVGEIQAALPSLAHVAPEFRIRNNAIALLALAEMRPVVDAAIGRFGSDRVAIVVGTSTSGLPEGEAARRTLERTGSWPRGFSYAQQELGNLADFLAAELGVTGVAHVISTACSSGAKSLASGARLLNAAMADAVVAGGCDALGAFTVAGFSALEAVSAARCNPMSVNRRGINLGEGAAFFLMTREPGPVRLAGWGESSDAHHMSTPDPTGRGAMRAMQSALQRAGVPAGAVDYINLHGTATHYNDAMESLAVAQVLGTDVPASSTKPLTGHTLAAAGAIEAAFGWLTLVDNPRGVLPPHWWDGQPDPALAPLRLVAPNDSLGRAPRYMLSNSFAFGGSNASVLLGRA
ncbi:beta-ketoacyl-ACP synthase [Verminephrobacter eiseniae]|uniref:beta-ketoacyl-ACP synthase n=1 Tax=Verminephrobacter eiseniae TaxID=364317 RepID=UPI00223833CD|nr:beta-ketoacyl-ACP synthase [Verminephrobacter eiseniae]MCW5262275.1 beta-ketoacyl-ACP synthase [Verminephrobacter eiseniae]